jgi:Contractile injection system tube protein
MSGFTNQPKILRGAFVEFGLSLPPLIVVFQFNPATISRSRYAWVDSPASYQAAEPAQNIDMLKQETLVGDVSGKSLIRFRNNQLIRVQQETINFDIRLDATDKLNEGDTITEQFGVSPKLSTLELMMLPKGQSLLGGAVAALLGGGAKSFLFQDDAREPPIILFVWGRKKILPVNITNMNIREEEFSTDLNPTRATIGVSLEVIEGPNLPFLYTRAMREVMSALNLANIAEVANTVVPQ